MPDITVTVETTPPPTLNVFTAFLPTQTGNAGKILATNGSTASWTNALTAPALSSVAGSQNLLFGWSINNGNNGQLQLIEYRSAAGGDWTTATTRLQKVVDSSTMGFIDFNPPGEPWGLSIGVGNGSPVPTEVLRFKKNGSDVVRPYTGFSYDSYASQHVAFTKKAGAYSYYFRKSDTGASDGPNLATLFEIRDNGDTATPGAAYAGLGYVINNYPQTRLTTATGQGWRFYSESTGGAFGDAIIQGTTDAFNASFVTPLRLKTNGDVEMPGGVLTGQRLEINAFAGVDQQGYIDICAQPGTDADTRISRSAGANGALTIQNGGSGNVGIYAGGTAGQPWTANKGFHINGSNGTLYLTSGLALENQQAIYFRDAGGSFPYMLTQTDNNWVFYGTGSAGGVRGIFDCVMRSDTSPLRVSAPLQIGSAGSPIKSVPSIVISHTGGWGSFTADETKTMSYSMTGIEPGCALFISFITDIQNSFAVHAYCPAANTIYVKVTNTRASANSWSTTLSFRALALTF